MIRMERYAFDMQGFASKAVQQVVGQLGDLTQLRERPFETLLKYVVPGLLFLRGRWILSILFGVSEKVLGIGPSAIGAWIDRAIGKGSGSGNAPVSENALATASEGVVGRLIGGLLNKSSSFRQDVAKRGIVDAQALLVAWAEGPDKTISKEAVTLGTRVRSLLAMRGGSSLLSGALFQLLKALLIGVGVHAGIGMLASGKTAPSGSPTPGGIPSVLGPSQTSGPSASGMRLYMNSAGDVERSIALTLDNAVKDKEGRSFSRLFSDLKGYSLIGSEEMGRILGEVRSAHGGASIEEINRYRTFAAPALAEIAKALLPQATYSKQEKPGQDAEHELEGIFGGRQK